MSSHSSPQMESLAPFGNPDSEIITLPGVDWLLNTSVDWIADPKKKAKERTPLPPFSPTPPGGYPRSFWAVVMDSSTQPEQTHEPASSPKEVLLEFSSEDQPNKCPIEGCEKRYKCAKDMKMHIRATHDEEFKCGRCLKLLTSAAKLRNHLKRKRQCIFASSERPKTKNAENEEESEDE